MKTRGKGHHMKKLTGWVLAAASVLTFGAGIVRAAVPTDTTIKDPTQFPGVPVMSQVTLPSGSMKFPFYVPPTYNSESTKRFPLILMFNMVGAQTDRIHENGGNLSWTYETIFKLLGDPAKCKYVSDSFIVVSEFLNSTTGWNTGLAFVNDWIHYLFKTYRIDSTCASIYGDCWGGNLGYWYMAAYPKVISSAALFCINGGNSEGGTWDLTKACSVKDIPIRCYNASGDPYAPWQNAQHAVNVIDSCAGGGKAEFIKVNDSRHEIYDYIDTTSSLYTWFLSNRRPPSSTSITPVSECRRQASHALNLDTRMKAGDHVEVIDVNGKLVLQSREIGIMVHQILSHLNRGLYLVRLHSRGSASARIVVSR
jgi:hypothetical protein